MKSSNKTRRHEFKGGELYLECRTCDSMLPEANFYVCRSKSYGRQTQCIKCQRKRIEAGVNRKNRSRETRRRKEEVKVSSKKTLPGRWTGTDTQINQLEQAAVRLKDRNLMSDDWKSLAYLLKLIATQQLQLLLANEIPAVQLFNDRDRLIDLLQLRLGEAIKSTTHDLRKLKEQCNTFMEDEKKTNGNGISKAAVHAFGVLHMTIQPELPEPKAVHDRFKNMSRIFHPDHDGDETMMKNITEAFNTLKKEGYA